MIQLIAFLYPVITGILSGIVPLRDKKNHRLVCGLIMILTDLLGILAFIRAERVEILHFSEKAVLSFELDDLGRFALAAVLILFTAVCFYSFTYMEHEKRTPMFFTFFFIALGAMMAVCMSADMVTLYFAFELATLSTVPMVMHEMSKESVTAGLKYMFYSIAGALMGLLAVFYVYTCAAGTVSFRYGGFLDSAKIAGHAPKPVCIPCTAGFRPPIRSRLHLPRPCSPVSSQKPVSWRSSVLSTSVSAPSS